MAIKEKDEVVTYIMEGAKGKYLRINNADDGDGTWFDWTDTVWDAYWHDLDNLEMIAAGEFHDFPEGYPKYHRIRFTYEKLDTAEDNPRK